MNAVAILPDHTSAGAMARGLFSADVAVAALDPRADHGPLLLEEREAILNAVDSRRREFTAGRVAARQAMANLSIEGCAIPAGEDRSPKWPDKLVGSISHCGSACVAVVARGKDAISLGVDVEFETVLDDIELDAICTVEELTWLNAQDPSQFSSLSTLLFSAKECAYKCQYPLTGCFFGFDVLRVEVDVASGVFEAVFNRAIWDFRAGHRLQGRFAIGAGMVITGMTLQPWDLPKIPKGWSR